MRKQGVHLRSRSKGIKMGNSRDQSLSEIRESPLETTLNSNAILEQQKESSPQRSMIAQRPSITANKYRLKNFLNLATSSNKLNSSVQSYQSSTITQSKSQIIQSQGHHRKENSLKKLKKIQEKKWSQSKEKSMGKYIPLNSQKKLNGGVFLAHSVLKYYLLKVGPTIFGSWRQQDKLKSHEILFLKDCLALDKPIHLDDLLTDHIVQHMILTIKELDQQGFKQDPQLEIMLRDKYQQIKTYVLSHIQKSKFSEYNQKRLIRKINQHTLTPLD